MKKFAIMVLVVFVLSLGMSSMAFAQEESGWQQTYDWIKGWSWTSD